MLRVSTAMNMRRACATIPHSFSSFRHGSGTVTVVAEYSSGETVLQSLGGDYGAGATLAFTVAVDG